jgi:hypothetical protein
MEENSMNAKQKNFILKKLIPFILREQGRGFGMDGWRRNADPGAEEWFDGVTRAVPVCGTVCCIGGSIEVLKKYNHIAGPNSAVAMGTRELGITNAQAYGLFYGWGLGGVSLDGISVHGWPLEFAERFRDATTPYRKARVAAALLKDVIRTNGECLNQGEE